MITDLEYTAWLSSPQALRCVLVEASVQVGGSETVRYLSDRGYTTSPTDSPANTTYKQLITGGVKLTETLEIESQPTIAFSDIELTNDNGDIDTWVNDVWENRSVTVLYGDLRWARSDFREVFKGTMAKPSINSRNKLSLSLIDSMQRLNQPLSETKLGGSTVNADKLIPICFGEVHNVTPLLIDATLHDYQVHNGAIEGFIEVRDNGIPLTVTPTIAAGKFRLNNSPFGDITASVQGSKPSTYSNQITEIIKNIVKNYGNTATRLTDADIDSANFSAFAAANTAPVGVYVTDRINVIELCREVAASVGAQVCMSRLGKLQLKRIDFPVVGTPTIVYEDRDMVQRSLSPESVSDVQAAVQIGYCKNYTTQGTLQTEIPDDHKALYAREYITTKQSDSAVATKYKIDVEPTQQDTLLLTTSDANTEASRRLAIVKQQRTVYRFTGYTSLFQLELGGAITIYSDRFGMSSGVTGVIVGLAPDWLNARIEVRVMV